MDCELCREALSADLDGVLDATGRDEARTHLAGCAACRAHEVALGELHRAVRVRAAEPVPDLTASIMAKVQLPGRRSVPDWARYALLAVATTQLVLALPPLLLGRDGGASVHTARELGSLNIALAAGLILAAWQPRRISGLLPVATALAATMFVTAVADVVSGRALLLTESHHVLELLGLLFLWLAGRNDAGADTPLVSRTTFGPRPA
jgi:predicted anti-sigma-YlaC factor YlaD